LKAGQTYKVTLKTESLLDASRPGPRTGFRLGAALQIDAKKEIENACAAAADADVAVVVVGLSPEYESEDFDRKHLKWVHPLGCGTDTQTSGPAKRAGQGGHRTSTQHGGGDAVRDAR
jgi:hypothetical protein